MQNLIDTYIRRGIARHYITITVVSLLLTLLAVWVIATRWNINSDFKALLPSHSAAAMAMEEVGDRVGSGSSLFVVIDSPDGEANIEFATVFSEKLREIPEIALAHFHNDKTFFEKNSLLYLEAEDLETLHERIKKRIRDEKRAANPLFVQLRPREKPASSGALIDTSDIEAKYDELAHGDYKEYLVSDDGYSLTIMVRFVETSTDLAATNRLLDRVRELGAELNPTAYHPEMTIEFGGGLVNRQTEYRSIVDDIQSSAIFTVVGLFLVIALFFRRVRAVAFVLSPLIMGVLWTLALAFSIHGELTTVTVFIFAILLGIGIDFSIHLLSGYDHERLEGKDPVEALIGCFNGVGRATVTCAMTTFVTFVVLSFAQFRGLSQFGQVAAIGILLTVVAMVTVLPSMILTAHRIWPHTPTVRPTETLVARLDTPRLQRFVALGGLTIGAVFTIAAAMHVGNIEFEENFRRIGKFETPWERARDKSAEQQRAQTEREGRIAARAVQQRAVSVRERLAHDTYVPDRKQLTTGAKYTSALSNKLSSTPTILLFDDADAAARVYRHMHARKRAGELETISSVASIHAFLPGTPEEQRERLEVIAEIRETVDREDLSILEEDDRKMIEEFRALLDVEEVTIRDLPAWTKRLFREAGPAARPPAEGEEFAYEYLVYVNERIDHMVGAEARRFLSDVQSVADETGEEFRIGSQSYIFTAMLDAIKTDGARMMSIAVVIVFLMLSVFFKSPVRSAMSLLPLTMGAFWLVGFSAWYGIKLDFFNVIILPVIMGVGTDDGVHFYHQYLETGRGSILEILRKIGGAITLTTVTSFVGFGGLAITNYAGLKSLGTFAMVGLAAAYLGTVLLLPGLLWLAERLGWTWVLPRS